METNKRTRKKGLVNISTDDFDPENFGDDVLAEDETPEASESNSTDQDDNKTASQNKLKQFVDFVCDKRVMILYSIVLCVIAVYVAVVSFSFLTFGAEDQNFVRNMSLAEMYENSKSIKNAGGPLGAFVSNLLIAEGIGIGIFVMVFYCFALCASMFKIYHFRFWPLTFKCVMISITTSIVVGLLTYDVTNYFHLGGMHGFLVNDFLIKMAGIWGAIGVSVILVAIVAVIFYNEISVVITKVKEALEARKKRISEEAKQEQETEATAEVEDDKPEEVTEIEDVEETDESGDLVILDFEPKDQDDSTNEEDSIFDPIKEPSEDASLEISTQEIEEAQEIVSNEFDPTAELSRYKFPSIDLLIEHSPGGNSVDIEEQEENKARIIDTLKQYKIEISQIKATVGPTVTLYEIVPAEGVRIARIKQLGDDIAMNLSALGIRIIAPIPGKGTIGIEVPNKEPQIVSMKSIISSKKYQESKAELPMAMGVSISSDVYIADLTKIPHLLVAGATGMGKSVGLNAIIASLLYKKHPAELKFVLIDPKMVELSLYRKLERHYLAKLPDEESAVITDPSKVVATMNSLCIEMENRYALLSKVDARSIKEYNAKFVNHRLNPEKGHRYLPYIVVIVDEFADLIMTAGKEIETPIARIAQKARAVGIHMILATQRPSTNVVTGLIKANFPGRVAFRVQQNVDSRTILDRPGAEQLIGKGDMLISRDGEIERAQCAFISTEEVVAICDSIDNQIGYEHAYFLPDYIPESGGDGGGFGSITDRDPLFEEAARAIINSQTASTSSLQRAYKIGYNRAGRIMDQMEAMGIVGPAQGGKPRQVLVDLIQLEHILASM